MMPRHAPLALICALLGGCQWVFGLDEYSEGAGAGGDKGVGGAGATASGGDGPNGGATTSGPTTDTTSVGGGGSTSTGEVCKVPTGFGAYRSLGIVAVGEAVSECAPDDQRRYFVGDPEADCSCECTAGGCEGPGLFCYHADGCSGEPASFQPDADCGGLGDIFASCRAAGPSLLPATCSASVQQNEVRFLEEVVFCKEPDVDACADDTCIVIQGDEACPSSFPNAKQVFREGAAQCGCDCTATCGAETPYAGGLATCGGVDIGGDCRSPIQGIALAERQGSPTCTTSLTANPEGREPHTVCCANPL